MNVAHNIAIFKNSLRVKLLQTKGEDRMEKILLRELLKAGMKVCIHKNPDCPVCEQYPVEVEVDLAKDQFIVRQPSDPKQQLVMPKAGEPGSGITKTPRKKT